MVICAERLKKIKTKHLFHFKAHFHVFDMFRTGCLSAFNCVATLELVVLEENRQRNRLNLIYFIGRIEGFD